MQSQGGEIHHSKPRTGMETWPCTAPPGLRLHVLVWATLHFPRRGHSSAHISLMDLIPLHAFSIILRIRGSIIQRDF